jgi:hypothetical protein
MEGAGGGGTKMSEQKSAFAAAMDKIRAKAVAGKDIVPVVQYVPVVPIVLNGAQRWNGWNDWNF